MLRLREREKERGQAVCWQSTINIPSPSCPICGCHPFYFLTFVPCEHLKQNPSGRSSRACNVWSERGRFSCFCR
ncbi:hypothetical protein K450DRAFT_225589 [Umbelopsis ramanniana AG]|uniref:Uncharacterized protein n=1 Tax=Umbelopsis ramanniana AG TaxID=1314678 RepID=A0AAD5HFZ7_UMBRA|nr:uncharacterized protein K450DRAFT_225589 [Umbelopsis ramanniana AG]KAI8582945.1 hypothetical protein K450DRAFT_225589 [Umbelopsis ramanniana AG]